MSGLLARLKGLFARGGFLRSVSVLAGGTALAQVLAVLASPVITRLFTPEDFGVLGVYASLLGILAVVATCRYELAIPLAQDEEEATRVLGLSFLLAVAVALGMAILLITGGSRIFGYLNAPQVQRYGWMLPLGVLLVGIYQILNYWAVRSKEFARIARTKISQSVGSIATQLGSGLIGLGPIGLISGHVVGQAAGITVLAKQLPFHGLRRLTIGDLRDAMQRFRAFPLLATPGAFLNTASSQLPVLVLTALYGPAVGGWFSLTQRMVSLPLQLIGNSVNQVFFAKVATLSRNSPASLRPLFLRIGSGLLIAAVLPAVALILWGPPLFGFVFGPDWHEAGAFGRALAPMLVLQFAISPIAHLNILERQELNLIWNVVRALLVVLAFTIAWAFSFTPTNAIVAYTVAMSVSYVLMAGLWLKAAQELAERRARHA